VDFAQQLKKIREDNCISQAKIAEAVGVDVTYISKMENGKMPPPSEDVIVKIAETFNVNVHDLIFSAKKVPSDIVELIMESPEVKAYLKSKSTKKIKSELMDNDPSKIREELLKRRNGGKIG
jgi:transcriptional regulator with XRE-family HTH domain